MKRIKILSFLAAGLLLFTSCHSSKKDDQNFIKVRITSGREQEIAECYTLC